MTEGNRDPWGILHKINRDKTKKMHIIGSLKDQNGLMTRTWRESILLLCKKFFPRDERQEENEKQNETRQRNSNYKNQNLEPDITQEELRRALKNTKGRTAPGLDTFPPEVIKQIGRSGGESLLALYNKCLRESIFPKRWKVAEVIIIPKRAYSCLTEISCKGLRKNYNK